MGFPQPPLRSFPMLWDEDEGYSLRSAEAIVGRCAALHATLGVACGLPRDAGWEWLVANGLLPSLTPQEQAVFDGEHHNIEEVRSGVEAVWGLAWVLGVTEHLDPSVECPDDFVHRMPDLRSNETLAQWHKRARIRLRSADEVMTQLDLHYCLTWGLANSNLRGEVPPGAVEQAVLWQRRRSLEWVIVEREWAAGDWDDSDLST